MRVGLEIDNGGRWQACYNYHTAQSSVQSTPCSLHTLHISTVLPTSSTAALRALFEARLIVSPLR